MTSSMNFTLMKRDPIALLAEVQKQLTAQTNGQWTDYSLSDPGFALVCAQLGLGNNDDTFTDKMGAECFLSTAQDRESLVRLAKSRGYVVGLAQPATVTVSLNFPILNTEILIPANTKWAIQGIDFTCLDQILIPAGQTQLLITLTQGDFYNQNFTAPGTAWWSINLPLNISNMAVAVNDVVWTQIDAWPEATVMTSYLREENPGTQKLRFGNNISTTRPNNGDIVTVTGILTDGASGNIEQKNLTVKLVSVVRDSNGNNITNSFNAITVTAALDGANLESSDSIRANAPSDNAAKGRAVTIADYVYWAGKYPGVTSVSGIGGELISRYSEVWLYIFGSDPYSVSTDLLNAVQQFVQSKAVGTIKVVVKAPAIIEMIQSTIVGVDNSFIDAAAQENLSSTSINKYVSSIPIGGGTDKGYRQSNADAAIIGSGADYSNTSFTLESFGLSLAGVITIPIPSNADLTNASLTDASGNSLLKDINLHTIQTANLTSFISSAGNTLVYSVVGLTDQTITLGFKSKSVDVLLSYEQKLVLKTLAMSAELIS